jgi:uncharacterized membrane-anchored protein YitT (DUF2179 family)
MDSLKHNIWEDLFGITIGAVLLSVGINILENGEILTGGTAGLALLIAHQFSQNVAIIYPLVSAPFLLLSWFKKGKIFTFRTALTVLYVSFLVNLVPQVIYVDVKNELLASLISNIFLTMGLLALFRHNSSVGGFGVVALIAQEQFNFKAGYAQLILDLMVMGVALLYYSPNQVFVSLLGVIVLNLGLAVNHRADRYLGYSND